MQIPETYDITITVAASGNPEVYMTFEMKDIPRAAIMAPDYDKGTQAVVKSFESMVMDYENGNLEEDTV